MNRISRLEQRISRLEKEAGLKNVQKFFKEMIDFVPQISKGVGAGKELIRLIISGIKLLVAEMNIMIRKKDKKKILYWLEVSFQESMANAFQTFVAFKDPPRLVKFNPENLLKSKYYAGDKYINLDDLLEYDAVVGQNAYNTYNQWVTEYGVLLDYTLGYSPKDKRAMQAVVQKGLHVIKGANKTFYRFLNIVLKVIAQKAAVWGLAIAFITLSGVWGAKAVIKWMFDKFNDHVDKQEHKLTGEARNLLFDPKKTASYKISHVQRLTVLLENMR